MAKNFWKNLSIIVLVLGLCITSFAQKLSEERVEFIYQTTSSINLRATPPSKGLIFISNPGRVMTSIKSGEQVVILEKRVINTIFSKTIWVKVRPINSTIEGWAYWGEGSNSSVNFREK